GFTTGIPATKGLLPWGATTAPMPPKNPLPTGETTRLCTSPHSPAAAPQNLSRTHSPRCSGEEGDHAPPAPLTRCHQLGLVFLIPHLLLLHVAAGEEEAHHPVEELVGELDGERDHVHLGERDTR
uniref:Uncharacterized protein n=1 Tax=Cairina moschata TaxID=8855 RepID=A0A8C3GLE7_CAIMO